jgi:AhpD family alkylhydroperoxidase
MSHPSFAEIVPDAYRAVSAVEAYIRGCGLEKSLVELVKMRASQINGCAFCLNMHSQDARKSGETEQRLYLLNAWREAPFYSDRERAALALTERLTRLPAEGAPPETGPFSPPRTRQPDPADRHDQPVEPRCHRRRLPSGRIHVLERDRLRRPRRKA